MAAVELESTPLRSDANLKGYWRLNGNSNDSLGSNNGADTNMSYAAAQFGNGGSFNGSSSIVRMASFVRPTGAMSITAWIKSNHTSDPSLYNKLIVGGDDIGSGAMQRTFSFSLKDVGSGTFRLQLSLNRTSGGFIDIVDTTTNLNTNTLRHVVATWDGTTAKLYVDGVEVKSQAAAGPVVGGTGIALGQFSDENQTPNYWWNGMLDDIAIFDRALTGTEVSNLYNGTFSTTYTETPAFTIAAVLALSSTQQMLETREATVVATISKTDAMTHNETSRSFTFVMALDGLAALLGRLRNPILRATHVSPRASSRSVMPGGTSKQDKPMLT